MRECPSAGEINDTQIHLTKEQILEIADAVAREHGYFPESELHRHYVEETDLGRYRAPKLEGHDYQVVVYQRLWAALGGELVVIVDRNTGMVLMEIGE